MKLTRLQANSVRGIPRDWPEIGIGKNGLVIYGQNGVGKSSIIDALEFGLTKKSTLFRENRLGVSWETASSHVRGGTPDITIEMKHGTATHLVAPDKTTAELPSEIEEWLSTAREASFVLRRHMLLRFIDTQPKDRYGLLEPFLNLGTYQSTEARLRTWADHLETKRVTITGELQTQQQSLRRIFGLDSTVSVTDQALLAQLNAKLTALNLQQCANAAQVKEREKEIAAALGGEDKTQRLAALGNLKSQVQRLGLLGNHKPLLESLRDALVTLEKETGERTEAILTDFLVRGKEIIETAGLKTCPLCEQDIENQQVLTRLEERIKADERITHARQVVRARTTALLAPIKKLADAMQTLMHDWTATISTPLPTAYDATHTLLTDTIAVVESDGVTSAQLADYPARFDAAVFSHDPLISTLDGLIAAEGGGERRLLLSDAAGMIEAFTNDLLLCSTSEKALKDVKRRQRVINRLYGHVTAARKEAVQGILKAVSSIANRLYEQIHPNENIATSTLDVRDVGEGSVNLSTDFYGKEEHPLLHHSESRLDTLGLCYFLAIRKHEAGKTPDFKLLILDDVLHSVDAEHRGRFTQLLKKEFADHQIVITTHDWHFYEALRRTLGTGGFSYQVISDWDIDRGPIIGDPSTDLDRILSKEQRQTKSHEELSAAGGRFFEWMIKELTEQLQVAVPARFNRKHDIGNLWPPLCSKLRKHRGFKAAYFTLVDELDNSSWVRNACGAHHNLANSAVTPSEVREFAGHLAALYSATYCSKCSSFIAKQVNEDWRCDCDKMAFVKKGVA